MSALTIGLIDDSGFVSPRAVADAFHITVKEVAAFSGLSLDAVSKQSRVRSKASQQRLRDIVLILNRVLPWCGAPWRKRSSKNSAGSQRVGTPDKVTTTSHW